MIQDLWNTFIIVLNFFRFCYECFTAGNLITFPSFLLTCIFLFICYFAWKSTNTPSNIPPPPLSPFVISIQTTTASGTVHRHTLQDIRLFSTQPYIRRLLNELQFVERESRNLLQRIDTSGDGNVTTVRNSVTTIPPQFYSQQSFFQRLWFRIRQQSRRHPPILLSYRRFFLRNPTTNLNRPELPSSTNATESQQTNQNNFQDQLDSLSIPIITSQPAHSSASVTRLLSNNQIETSESSEEITHQVLVDNLQNQRFTEDNISETCSNSEQTVIEHPVEKVDEEMNTAVPPEGQMIKFTIKFLNDTQIEVETSENEKVGNFKRRQFIEELSENKTVRLIFNGRVLDENRTLKEAGVFEQCVVHCLIVTPQQLNPQSNNNVPVTGNNQGYISGRRYGPPGNNNNRQNSRGPEPGMFFITVMGGILVILWSICFNFGQQLFTQSAVVSLSVLTGIFLIGLVAFYLPVHPTTNNNTNNN